MKRLVLLCVLTLATVLPAAAQSTEFGFIVGGSRRFVETPPFPEQSQDDLIESNFALGNSSFDLFWGLKMDEDVWLKFKAGRIETQIAQGEGPDDRRLRFDTEGEVQHIEAITEYRFSEAFGSTALFGGVGFYRQSPDEGESSNNWGLTFGVNGDFPITRRYGVVVEGAYHWTRGEFRPRYLTVGAGLRVGF